MPLWHGIYFLTIYKCGKWLEMACVPQVTCGRQSPGGESPRSPKSPAHSKRFHLGCSGLFLPLWQEQPRFEPKSKFQQTKLQLKQQKVVLCLWFALFSQCPVCSCEPCSFYFWTLWRLSMTMLFLSLMSSQNQCGGFPGLEGSELGLDREVRWK